MTAIQRLAPILSGVALSVALWAAGCADATEPVTQTCSADGEWAKALQPVIYGEASWVSVGEAADAPYAALRTRPVDRPTPVFLASHPLGTSTKVDVDATVRPSARGPGHLWLRADAFRGSSGAGVFDVDGRLVGVLTAGLSDFNYDRDAGCMRLIRSDAEGFERVASVQPVLQAACQTAPGHDVCRIFDANPSAEPAPIAERESTRCNPT